MPDNPYGTAFTLEKNLYWAVTITRFLERERPDEEYSLRPKIIDNKPYLLLACTPEHTQGFLIRLTALCPHAPYQENQPDETWDSILIPLPGF